MVVRGPGRARGLREGRGRAGDALVRAHAIAEAGAAAYPDSIGAQRCRAIVAAIEAPAYQLTTMILDGPDRRSIEVDHANLPAAPVSRLRRRSRGAPAHVPGLQPPSRLAGDPEADRRRAAGGGVDGRAAADARLPPAPDVRDAAAPPSRAVRRGGLRARRLPARERVEPAPGREPAGQRPRPRPALDGQRHRGRGHVRPHGRAGRRRQRRAVAAGLAEGTPCAGDADGGRGWDGRFRSHRARSGGLGPGLAQPPAGLARPAPRGHEPGRAGPLVDRERACR